MPWHGFDEHDYQFVSAYRRRFTLPHEARGQRVFVDFEGVMTATRVWLNGKLLGAYKGGYTPFSFELDTPPECRGRKRPRGRGGFHRAGGHSSLRQHRRLPDVRRHLPRGVPAGGSWSDLRNIFVEPRDVMGPHPSLAVHCHLEGPAHGLRLEVAVLAGEAVVARGAGAASAGKTTLALQPTSPLRRWDTEDPFLHQAVVRLYRAQIFWTRTCAASASATRRVASPTRALSSTAVP
jgi:beta-galactosidase